MLSVELLTASGPYGLQLRAQAWEFFDYFIPVMVVFIIIEALYSYAHDLELYEFNDTITRYAIFSIPRRTYSAYLKAVKADFIT